jgi:GT2 family glycosyltransferase
MAPIFRPKLTESTLKNFSTKASAKDINKARANKVSVLIPIYGMTTELNELIDIVLRNFVNGDQLILCDDCSDTQDVTKLLKKYSQDPRVQTLVNPMNLGFTKTVNKMLKLRIKGNDVIILNSDTIPFGNFIETLSQAGYSSDKVASVTPISNSGSVASYPIFGRVSSHSNFNSEQFEGVVNRSVRLSPIEVISGVGFCLFMRNDALKQVNAFDESNFPRGYGEEVDWSLKLKSKGYIHLLDPNSYVHHSAGKSFTAEERQSNSESAEILLKNLYDEYTKVTELNLELKEKLELVFPVLDVKRLVHDNNTVSVPKVMILHSYGGGIETFIDNELGGCGYGDVLIEISSSGESFVIHYKGSDSSFYPNISNPEIKNMPSLCQVLKVLNPAILEVHSLASANSEEAIMQIEEFLLFATKKNKSKVELWQSRIYLHDYIALCPRTTATYPIQNFPFTTRCNIPTSSNDCDTCVIRHGASTTYSGFVGDYRQMYSRLVKRFDVAYTMSYSQQKQFSKIGIKTNVWPSKVRTGLGSSVLTSPLKDFKSSLINEPKSPKKSMVSGSSDSASESKLCEILFVGAISGSKGSQVIQGIHDSLSQYPVNIRTGLLGKLEEKGISIQSSVNSWFGEYEPNELGALMKLINPEIVFLPFVGLETYSILADELRVAAPTITIVGFDDSEALIERKRELSPIVFLDSSLREDARKLTLALLNLLPK